MSSAMCEVAQSSTRLMPEAWPIRTPERPQSDGHGLRKRDVSIGGGEPSGIVWQMRRYSTKQCTMYTVCGAVGRHESVSTVSRARCNAWEREF
ncbi:hypothetical protein HBI56_028720 [Parastagonospora nodorum]|nr:hypothetical protein HBH56_016340 [Parastagonospora nodorum]KAH3936738.1 hypothetical protein HBH54_018120 [Parastagonospora nodorum]KAH3953935.1 hypothetical protein HBH53_030510 [Parastagonospora nodorum]KAH3969187.1 hypothetical protein HBH51_122660 [Parastagonospora nodorum]KAH4006798.1 hypothetical protein HBI10_017930 [Parastagonospora nodorum]